MKINSQAELHEFLKEVITEVEEDLFRSIKFEPSDTERLQLLYRVDALTLIEDQINARLQRIDPFNP